MDFLFDPVFDISQSLEFSLNMTLAAHTRMKESTKEQPKIISNIAAFTKQQPNADNADPNKSKKGKKKKPRGNRHCNYCSKDNHDEDYCLIKSRDIISGKLKPESAVKSAEQTKTNPNSNSSGTEPVTIKVAAFIANFGGESHNEIDPNGVYIDTCAGSTVTNKIEDCIGELRKMDAIIKDWENRESRVHGVGEYMMLTETGCTLTIKDVIYKSTTTGTFISYAKLMATGKFRIIGEDDWIEFRYKETNQLIMTARKVSANIMKLGIKPHPSTLRQEVIVGKVTISPTAPTEFMYRFWHNKLGHSSFGYLQKQAVLLGLASRLYERLVCDVCTATKATRLPFPISSSMAEHPFDLVHTDLSGIV